jgi:hypothetical protein
MFADMSIDSSGDNNSNIVIGGSGKNSVNIKNGETHIESNGISIKINSEFLIIKNGNKTLTLNKDGLTIVDTESK